MRWSIHAISSSAGSATVASSRRKFIPGRHPMQSSTASPAPAAGTVTPSWTKDFRGQDGERNWLPSMANRSARGFRRGLHQVAEFWRAGDGDAAAFEDFVRTNFAGDQATLDTMFNRLEQFAGATRRPHARDQSRISPADRISISAPCFPSTKLLAVTILPRTWSTISSRTNSPSWCC